jgi:cobalt-zinc-cadmium efflux system outer membrane protein
MKVRASIAVLSLLVLVSRGVARDVSFDDARLQADRGAPQVQLAAGQAGVSRAEVDVAGALPNPTLGMTTATITARLAARLSAPLPLFGQRGSAMRAARADVQAALLDVAVSRRDARWGATLAWIDLWEAQERARLLELGARDSQRLSQIAAENFAAGSGARLDVVRTDADYARALAEAESAQRLTAAAGARLAPWIGSSGDDELIASGAPGYSAAEVELVRLEQRLPEHPALQRDRATVDAAAAHVASEQRQRWPLLSPEVGVSAFDPTQPGTDVIFGLSLEVPILDQRKGPIERARAQRTLAETSMRLQERQLRADLLDAYRRTQAASAELRALRERVLPAMQQAKDMTQEGYQAGRVDLLRVLEAQRALLESRIAEAGSFAAWARAVADLERAAGADFAAGGGHAR